MLSKRRALFAATLLTTAFAGYKLRDPECGIYKHVVLPLFYTMDPENAHNISLWALENLNIFRATNAVEPSLEVNCLGNVFPNPVGFAAGYDKDARVAEALWDLGFGFVEIGSVLPKPQPGNPKPRLFRITDEKAIVNRMGFNSQGMDAVEARLQGIVKRTGGRKILGVNLGKNKTSETEEQSIEDYVKGIKTLSPYAKYLVINVSSPNTPNLRLLQERDKLDNLLGKIQQARKELPFKAPPLLLKIAPDMSEEQLSDIATVSLDHAIDGIIISNTTIQRSMLKNSNSPVAKEQGGLSGKPLLELSTKALSHLYQQTQGKLCLIGVGGVSTGEDAFRKIKAGASLVQLYSGFIYEGPGIARKVNRELLQILQREGYKSVSEAVGADHKPRNSKV